MHTVKRKYNYTVKNELFTKIKMKIQKDILMLKMKNLLIYVISK